MTSSGALEVYKIIVIQPCCLTLMILSVPTVIQSPLGWSKSIHVTAEFSSRKAARVCAARGERRRKRRERGEREERKREGEGREEKERGGRRERERGRGVRWSNIYKL